MNKSTSTIVGIIVLIIVVGGGYAIFHKSPKSTSGSSSGYSYNSPSSTTPKSTTSSGAAVNNAVLKTATSSSVGSYLTDPNGNTLYTYSSDSSGVSNCTGSCVSAWPPYVDTGATSGLPTNVSTLKRSDDGKTQYTYKGMPLYTFTSDSKGQVTGNGADGFAVAKP
jgi:predicted lipoprotein with Yx(FWY)xxD motif